VAVVHNGITTNFGDKGGEGKPERAVNLVHEAVE